ncbi:unnamed protein product [Adineta ricciae]|uniref:RRM domain-containing protein n=1 Tax=Adineta ricciae TaxID=249248 RepID=A0A814UCR3_ADIRI|nr:unnamed protein product [Adineta ricciae]
MFIRVTDDPKHYEDSIEIPIDGDADGSVSLSTLAAQFHGVSALKYRHSETSVWRGVRVVDGKLYHPDGVWDLDTVYVAVYSKPNSVDVKRKGFDEQDDSTTTYAGQYKTQKLENRSDINEQDRDASRRCVDLIVLGISYQSVEADVRKCFEIFGELELCEIKRDSNGQSRGFGFIRYKNYESQLAVMNKRHFIDGRYVDVKLPDSKISIHEPECARKIFVTRLTDNTTEDDLRQYFSKYGSIQDVYIPKPPRSFGFVTFHDSNIVRTLFGSHIINGRNVTVGLAEPKQKPSTATSYPTSIKRSKANHADLQSVTSYPYYHQTYGQSATTDRVYSYYPPYNVTTNNSSKEQYSSSSQFYWNDVHNETAGIWQ